MTTAERIESTRQKIEKRNSIVAKNENLISRKKAKIDRLTAKDAEANENEIFWLSNDIENLESSISEDKENTIPSLQKTLEELEAKLEKETARKEAELKALEPFKTFMEDLEQTWNTYDIERCNKIPEAINTYRPIYKEARKELDKEYRTSENKMSYREYRDREDEIERNFAESMEAECGIGWEKLRYMSETEIIRNNKKSVYDLVINFIERVKDKVGSIESLDDLKVGKKCLEGTVKGDKGTVSVWSRWAGGYNVQRLHVRVYIR